MSRKPPTPYVHETTHVLNWGELGQRTNRWLAQEINVSGHIVPAGEATDKEFAIYIWSVLPQLYRNETKMIRAFDEHFNRDWSSQMDRANALAHLVEINRSRKKEKRIRLFVD